MRKQSISLLRRALYYNPRELMKRGGAFDENAMMKTIGLDFGKRFM